MQAAFKRSELKDHIATVASALFYRDGIHAVGVDRIALEAGVAKRTLYHHYRSKDDLITAALRVSPIINFPRDGEPGERILGAFSALKDFLATTDYRGCPYIFLQRNLWIGIIRHGTSFSGALPSGAHAFATWHRLRARAIPMNRANSSTCFSIVHWLQA